MDFVMALPRAQRGRDSVMVVVNRFTKMAQFMAYHKRDNVSHVADLYFKEISWLHGIPKTIGNDEDTKFLPQFWWSLWHLLKTKLLYNAPYHPKLMAK